MQKTTKKQEIKQAKKYYKQKITSKKRFYKQIGFEIQNDWISMFESHPQLFSRAKYRNQTVLQRLVEEFKVEKLRDIWTEVECVLKDEFTNN